MELKKECLETLKYVNEIIAHIRRLAHDLSPAALQDLGLVEALKSLVDEFSKHSQIKLTMEIAKIDNLLPLTSEVIIYRVFQEILTNIEKHSNTEVVKINIKKEKNHIRFLIRDNGIGFDMKKLKSKSAHEKGLGFSSMDERIKMLGGQLHVREQKFYSRSLFNGIWEWEGFKSCGRSTITYCVRGGTAISVRQGSNQKLLPCLEFLLLFVRKLDVDHSQLDYDDHQK